LPGAWLILPTYDEAENVEAVVRAALDQLATTGRDHTVLVVDDGSPDGTGEIADRLADELDYVDVLHRERKQGLGPAYLAGFRHVLGGEADLILEMDCDFSHDPADVPRLLAAAAHADLVLGSRYVEGGSIPNWGLVRRAISRAASLYARLWLGWRVRDATAGFRCFRREVLERIEPDTITAKGYAFQIETTHRALAAGFRVDEIPIAFVERGEGGSKMSKGIVLEALWRVPALRFRR